MSLFVFEMAFESHIGDVPFHGVALKNTTFCSSVCSKAESGALQVGLSLHESQKQTIPMIVLIVTHNLVLVT